MIQGVKRTLAISVVALVCACGGGGGGGGFGNVLLPPPAPGNTDTRPSAAIATSDKTLGNVLTLDGSGSSSTNGKPVSYSWSLQSKPELSTAELLEPTSAQPRFLLDFDGNYVVRLVVNDGEKDSEPAYLTITPLPPAPTLPFMKFAIVEGASFPINDRTSIRGFSTTCNLYRAEEGFSDFSSIPPDIYENCSFPKPDFVTQSASTGDQPISPDNTHGPVVGAPNYFTIAAGQFPGDAPASPVRLSYEIGADTPQLARIPAGKSGTSTIKYAFGGPGSYSRAPFKPNAISYRIAGSMASQNAPKGWEIYSETTVQISLAFYADGKSTRRLDIYSKTFISDFDEKIEFDPNPPPPSPTSSMEQSIPHVRIFHNIAFRRIKS